METDITILDNMYVVGINSACYDGSRKCTKKDQDRRRKKKFQLKFMAMLQ